MPNATLHHAHGVNNAFRFSHIQERRGETEGCRMRYEQGLARDTQTRNCSNNGVYTFKWHYVGMQDACAPSILPHFIFTLYNTHDTSRQSVEFHVLSGCPV